MAGIQHKPVGVFWDIENCSVPRTKSPSDVIAHIRNFFVFNRLNHREYEFFVSCDVTRLRKDIPEDINKAGIVTTYQVQIRCGIGEGCFDGLPEKFTMRPISSIICIS